MKKVPKCTMRNTIIYNSRASPGMQAKKVLPGREASQLTGRGAAEERRWTG